MTAYERDIPSARPAVADAVMRAGEPGDSAIVATLLDLACRRLLLLRPCTRVVTSIFGRTEKDSHEFVVDVARWDEFDLPEQQLVSLLFTQMKHSATMSLIDLRQLLRSREHTYAHGIAAWRAAIVTQAVAQGYLEPGGTKLTAAGKQLRERCEALHAYIRDFGRFEAAQTMSIELWGPYLVWATLFGLAEEVIRAMRLEATGMFDDLALAAETIQG